MDDHPAGVHDVHDDRPPICPACGVTMGMVLDGPRAGYVCLECGFEEEGAGRSRRREHDT